MKVLFRVDASGRIGSGHVMRCLTLAREIQRSGGEVYFACREHKGHLCDFIVGKGFFVFRLPEGDCSVVPSRQESDPSFWLSVDRETDVREVTERIAVLKNHFDWLVVDHYGIDAKWESSFKPMGKHILVIDDLANRTHECDLLLDQNLHGDMEKRYTTLVPERCRCLTGPRYALLREEFQQVRAASFRSGVCRRILIFFGGVDLSNETVKALLAVRQSNLPNIEADVVVGQGNPHKQEVEALCASSRRFHYHYQINNMAELMTKADLAIGAGGSTTWERCCLGLPAMLISVAANQVPIAQNVERHGLGMYLGSSEDVTADKIANKLIYLYSHPEHMLDISKKAQKLVDGKGANRVVDWMRTISGR